MHFLINGLEEDSMYRLTRSIDELLVRGLFDKVVNKEEADKKKLRDFGKKNGNHPK